MFVLICVDHAGSIIGINGEPHGAAGLGGRAVRLPGCRPPAAGPQALRCEGGERGATCRRRPLGVHARRRRRWVAAWVALAAALPASAIPALPGAGSPPLHQLVPSVKRPGGGTDDLPSPHPALLQASLSHSVALPQTADPTLLPTAGGGAAWGSYVDSRRSPSNFGELRVTTSGNYSDADQVGAGGVVLVAVLVRSL